VNKFLKYGLLAVGSVGLLVAAVLAYIAATFNPNDYKAKIIQVVQEKKQRTLKLDGDIKLTLFPNIGASIGRASLSEFQSKQDFVTIENVQVSLALWPLFSKQVVVNQVAVSGLKATIIKYKNGKTNLDDLLGAEEQAIPEPAKDEAAKSVPTSLPVTFDIASVSLRNLNLIYQDEASAAQYEVNKLNLKTGRITMGAPIKLELDALIKANKPKLDLTTKLQGNLLINPEAGQFGVQGLDLQANGNVLDIHNVVLQAKGNFQKLKQELTAEKVSLSISGIQAKNTINTQLELPSLRLSNNQLSSEKFTLDLEMQQPQQTFKIKLLTAVNGNLDKKIINLPDLSIKMNGTGDALPQNSVTGKAVSSEMSGSLHMQDNRAQVKLTGGLLQSQVKIQVAVNNFTKPEIKFDIEADQLDVDAYLPKSESAPQTKEATSLDAPLDLSALKGLNLDGRLRIGAFKVANLKMAQVNVGVKAQHGIVDVSPLAANLYQGSVSGSLRVNVQGTPEVMIQQKLREIHIAPLLKDMADFDTLSGRGDVTLNLITQGNTVNALKKALNGTAALQLQDGAIKGINLAKKIRDAQDMFGKKATTQTEAVNKAEKTDFSELKANFKVSNGVAHNEDLLMKSPLLRLSGAGDIDIGNDSINYLARVTLAKTLQGQGGNDQVGGLTVPVRLSGPFTHLKYKLEFGAMVSDAAKQKIEAKKEEINAGIKTEAKEQLKNKLKGLFK